MWARFPLSLSFALLWLSTNVQYCVGGENPRYKMLRPLREEYTQLTLSGLGEKGLETCKHDFANESANFDNVIRMHVPKTGTSFTLAIRKILHACYGLNHQDFPCWEGKNSANLPDDHCSNHLYDCNGHYGLNSEHMERFRNNSQGSTVMITMIRDPAHRLLSAYLDKRHRNGFKGNGKFRTSDYGNFNLKSIQEFATLHAMQGCQVKMLTGLRCAQEAPLDQRRLEKAKDNLLKEFDFFGITDQFDESVWLLHKHFGILPDTKEFQPYRYHMPPVFFNKNPDLMR